MSNYPDSMSGADYCHVEGHLGPNCSRCGHVNYRWLGYLGHIGRMAKKWGVSKTEAEARLIEQEQQKARP